MAVPGSDVANPGDVSLAGAMSAANARAAAGTPVTGAPGVHAPASSHAHLSPGGRAQEYDAISRAAAARQAGFGTTVPPSNPNSASTPAPHSGENPGQISANPPHSGQNTGQLQSGAPPIDPNTIVNPDGRLSLIHI